MRLWIVILFLCWFTSAKAGVTLTAFDSTNAIPATATNTTASTAIDLINTSKVTVYTLASSVTNTASGALTIRLQSSLDGTYWSTLGTNGAANNGTNVIYPSASFDCTAFRYIRVSGIETTGTNALVLTNYYLLK